MNLCRSMCTAVAALSLGVVGCSNAGESPNAGSNGRKLNEVRMQIRLPDGTELNSLTSTITGGPSMITRATSIDFSNSATILYREGGLPVGMGYHVELEGTTTGMAPCVGEADFSVPDNTVTTVMLTLFCGDGADDVDDVGDAIFDVAVEQNNGCPVITAITALPLEVYVGSSLDLTAASTSATATYAWTGMGGTFGTPGAAATSFTCTAPSGSFDVDPASGHELTVSITDGACTDSWSLHVYCTPPAGSLCGNSTTDVGETCDDGNTVTEQCAYGQMSCTVCNSLCQSVAGETDYCGDGVIDMPQEECDGVSPTCNAMCEVVEAPADCGNSITETGETCDDGNEVTEECAYGQMSCTVCNATCQSAPGETDFCGDGTIDMPQETCDSADPLCVNCQMGTVDNCTPCREANCTMFTEDLLNVYGGCFLAIDTSFGAPASDPTFLQDCMDTVQCAFDNNCAYDPARGPSACYCGTRSASDCAVMGPAADAPCVPEWTTATRASSNAEVVGRFSALQYPSGWAFGLLSCDALLCDACTP